MKFDSEGRVIKDDITPEAIVADAQKILSPYTMTFKHLVWWTVYQIGQRVSEGMAYKQRIFLAGDAVHTHSPKMGQGMNTSMQDTYNLGWKLGLVLKGLSPRITLLETYEQERLKVAKALIDFDIRYSSLFSGRPLEEVFQETNIKPEDLPRIWRKNNSFTSGLGIEYESSMLTFAEKSKQELAKNVHVGIRIASTLVTNQADACQIELGKRMLNDGRFRILMFAGDLADADQNARIKGFVQKLAEPNSFANRYSGPTGTPYFNPLIETLTIHASDRKAFELADFPEELHPFDEEYGWAYDRIYAEGERNATKTYDYYAIDRKKGCVVIVRPDHHVGWIGQCEDIEVMDEYFSGIFQRADKMNGK